MARYQDKYHESGLAAQVNSIRKTAKRFDETMLSNLDGLQGKMQGAFPELVNDTNIARIADALRFIDNELNYYFADSDTVHLANALETGLQNFHQALRRSFGYWQMGRGPNQMGRNP